jgi:methionyl-tRNA synthetase
LRQRYEGLPREVFGHIDDFAIAQAVASLVGAVGDINRYVEHSAPWVAAREGRTAEVETVLYSATEGLRLTSVLLRPVMSERMAELWRRLGWQPPGRLSEALSWGGLTPGTPVAPGPPLFPRLEA